MQGDTCGQDDAPRRSEGVVNATTEQSGSRKEESRLTRCATPRRAHCHVVRHSGCGPLTACAYGQGAQKEGRKEAQRKGNPGAASVNALCSASPSDDGFAQRFSFSTHDTVDMPMQSGWGRESWGLKDGVYQPLSAKNGCVGPFKSIVSEIANVFSAYRHYFGRKWLFRPKYLKSSIGGSWTDRLYSMFTNFS